MKKYYYAENNEQKGPYSLNELKEKKISPITLVWREGLNDWIEARKLNELENLFKSIPPPLIKKDISDNLESKESSKIKDSLKTQKVKTKIAKEIKLSSKIFFYSIIIGLISYPFFAYKGFKAINLKNKYVKYKYEFTSGYGEKSNQEINKMGYNVTNQITDLVTKGEEDFYRTWESSGGLSSSAIANWSYKQILNDKIFEMKSTNIGQATLVIFTSFFIILISRAIFIGGRKSTKWVSENSKKEL